MKPASLNRSAFQATLHCLTGCAIGEVISITIMEIVDNGFIVIVPGAINAGLADGLFWWSLGLSLVLAFVAAFPANRWLIQRGRGHAVVHELHAHG